MESDLLLTPSRDEFLTGSSELIPINGTRDGNSQRTFPSTLLNPGNYVYIRATRGDFHLDKTAHTGVTSTCMSLTQPTGLDGGLGWKYYTSLTLLALWDSIGAFFFCRERRAPSSKETIMSDEIQITRPDVVNAIASLRQEWQQAAPAGTSLIDVNGSIGLVLYDLAAACNLSESEMTAALGSGLVHELTAAVSQ